MNQKEKQAAERLAYKVVSNNIHCPSCLVEIGLVRLTNNNFQLNCIGCGMVFTFYAQEPKTRVFDKQRNVERAIPSGPPKNAQPMKRKKHLVPFLKVVEDAVKGRRR